MINERWSIFADVRLHAHGEQQLQQGIAIFFSIVDIAQIQLRCDFTQLCFIGRERVNFQMALKRLLIGETFRRLALQHLLQQIVHLIDQAIHVIAWTIPLQHGEFRIVMTPHLFITEAAAQLEDRAATCRQQALHVVFRTGHQVQVKPLRMARADETGFEREQMNIRYVITVTAFAVFVLTFFSQNLIQLFMSEPNEEVIKLGAMYLHIIMIFFIFLGLLLLYRNILQGMGQVVVPLLSGTTELIMRTVFAFAFGLKFGFLGICFATPAAWFGATVVLFSGYKISLLKILKNRRKHV